MKLNIRFILLPSNFQQFVPRCFISPNHRYTYSMRMILLNKTDVPLNFWFREIQFWDSVDTVLIEVESMFWSHNSFSFLKDLVSTTMTFHIIHICIIWKSLLVSFWCQPFIEVCPSHFFLKTITSLSVKFCPSLHCCLFRFQFCIMTAPIYNNPVKWGRLGSSFHSEL